MFPSFDYNLYPQQVSIEMLSTSQYSSDSYFAKLPFFRIIEDEKKSVFNRKLSILKNNIGHDLYSRLTDQQINFMVGVSGAISVGKDVDLESALTISDDE